MKVTIELPPQHMEFYRKWASVSRTLNGSKELLRGYYEEQQKIAGTEEQLDDIQANLEELDACEPALNALHHAVRDQIWEQDRQAAKQREKKDD